MLGEEAITLAKLQKHIRDQHPNKVVSNADGQPVETPFGLCDSLGTLPIPLGKYFEKDVTEMS